MFTPYTDNRQQTDDVLNRRKDTAAGYKARHRSVRRTPVLSNEQNIISILMEVMNYVHERH